MPTLNIYIPEEDWGRTIEALAQYYGLTHLHESHEGEDVAKTAIIELINNIVSNHERERRIREMAVEPVRAAAPRQWSQPADESDAYGPGEIVVEGNRTWRSTAPNNTRRPGEDGWEEV